MGSRESRTLIHLSSSSVYGRSAGAGATSGTDVAGAGMLDGVDMVT